MPFAAPWLFPGDYALLKALNDSVCYDLINICFFHSLSFCFDFDLLDLGNNISLVSLIVKIFFSLFYHIYSGKRTCDCLPPQPLEYVGLTFDFSMLPD